MDAIAKPWQGTNEEIFQKLESSANGLSDFEAQKRLLKFGVNTVARQTPIPYFQIFFDQFVDLLVIILIVAAVLSFILGDMRNGVIISIIVLINALIGFTQEFKAEKILRALVKLLPITVKVKRDGEEKEIKANYLVPGDIVILGEGDKVPADIRLIEAYDLKVDEQVLTGESNPQNKKVIEYPNDNLSILQVENVIFMGTTIARGEGLGLVAGTGKNTEFGKIATKTMAIDKTLSPLQEKTHQMAKRVAILAAIITILLIIYKYFIGRDILDALIFSVAVAAALVPEGLPATVSVALSIGAKNLARHKALVKNLVSVETLGSTTIICTDKTGTLTTGKMVARELWRNPNLINSSEEGKLINEALVLCNDAQKSGEGFIGDPTETALLGWVEKEGFQIDEIRKMYTKVDEIPFNSERKYMSVTFRKGTREFVYSKGAPEVIMAQCTISEKDKELISEKFRELASEGFRVLGLSFNQTFLGLVAIFDPPREEVKEAIESCKEGSIRILMITGDNPITATSIAKMVGIIGNENPEIYEGDDLDRMSDIELRNVLRKAQIFARILPEQKYRIVDNLMQMGEIVAATGDGVNDAPALKRADIGIAMGQNGTDVSREAADMVLLDDNFATIVRAIKEGRTIFDNIRKFLFYIFSSNFGELLTVIVGFVIGLANLPILAVQILAVDLGTDVLPSMSLIGEKAEDVMKTKPRSKEVQLLTGESFLHLTIIGLVMGIGAVINFEGVLKATGTYHAATTASLATLVVSQAFNIFLSRCPNTSIFKYPFWSNIYVILSVSSSLTLIVLMVYLEPFHNFLLTDSFPIYFWPRIILVGLSLLVIEELYKLIKKSLILKNE